MIQRLKDFALYKFKSKNKFGIHSPFIFEFVNKVLYEDGEYYSYQLIEKIRKHWLSSSSKLKVVDLGAGSKKFKTNDRKIKAICRISVQPKKYGQLLFRIVNYFQPENIIELGTSLGITTAYLGSAAKHSTVFSIEGDPQTYKIAQKTIRLSKLENVKLINESFKNALPEVLGSIEKVDLVFIDGHHEKNATINYFENCLKKSHDGTVFIFDDINWTDGMKQAWMIIKDNPAVTATVDLHFLGIAFLHKGLKKEHFLVNY